MCVCGCVCSEPVNEAENKCVYHHVPITCLYRTQPLSFRGVHTLLTSKTLMAHNSVQKTPTKTDKPPSSPTPPLVFTLPATPSLSPSKTKHFTYDGVSCNFSSEPPHKFICSICTQLVKDPHLTACCGQEFCEGCLGKWEMERRSEAPSCPHCRQERFVHILDKQTRREVEELNVRCPERAHGCEWEGELKMAKAHQTDCSFTPVRCPNCSVLVPRKNTEKHATSECAFRESECVYCGREDAYIKVISFVHLAECPGYPMGCPNHCGASDIKRSNLPLHRESCPLEEIECPLKMAGCPHKFLRKDLEVHVMTAQPQHLLLLMTSFEKSQKELCSLRREVRELTMFKVTTSEAVQRMSESVDQLMEKSLTTVMAPLRSIRSLLGSGHHLILNSDHRKVSLVVPNLSQLEKKQAMSWESLPFFLDTGYKVCLSFLHRLAKSSTLAAELRLVAGEFDDELQWPCNIDFSNIYLSLSSKTVSNNRSNASLLSRKSQPPFCLSAKGKNYTDVTRCPTQGSHHLLWQSEAILDSLPPYPSAIRAHYLQNDCLTVTLTWGHPDGVGLESRFLNMLLERGERETTENGATNNTVRESRVSVSTSTGRIMTRRRK